MILSIIDINIIIFEIWQAHGPARQDRLYEQSLVGWSFWIIIWKTKTRDNPKEERKR